MPLKIGKEDSEKAQRLGISCIKNRHNIFMLSYQEKPHNKEMLIKKKR